jgi:DNA-binding MarR family transcriptional regulator
MAISRHPGPAPDDYAAAVDDALQPLLELASRATAGALQRVSSSQLHALQVIQQHGAMNLTGLAEALEVIPSSATRLCDRLIAADLLTRTAGSPDRREVVLKLTPGGNRVVRQVRDARRDALSAAMAGLSERERRALLTGLTGLAGQLPSEAADTAQAAERLL